MFIITYILIGTVDRYDRLQVEYNGFCPVALLSGGKSSRKVCLIVN